ncbi:MAG: LysM peptidoglycan-binding domain-containing protein [Actinomycetota bacterium]
MAYTRKFSVAAAVAVCTFTGASFLPVPAGADTTHVVEPGDTLSAIAREYGITTAELADANGISDVHLIKVGQALQVPGAAPVEHVVIAGDTISHLARTYGVSASEIVRLNGLADANRIRVGQRILLPANADTGSSLASLSARYPNLPRSISDNPGRLGLVPSFERWAAHYDIPTDLLMAVAYQESGWQDDVISEADAIGVGQLLPTTATWVATDLIGDPSLDPYVADDNIRMSARFLVWLIGFHGNESEALAGYYQGPTSVVTRGNFPQTDVYVASVSAGRARFQRS